MKRTLRNALLSLVVLFAGVSAGAGEITEHSVYVYLDTQARQITLDGMKQRLAALAAGERDLGALLTLGSQTREEVDKLFADWGMTPAQHAAYGSRNGEAIEGWIEQHPTWARTYEKLETRFQSLSSQLNAAR